MFNKEYIHRNSIVLYGKMKRMYHYTFDELQRLVNLESTELCLALIQLLQEEKISQEKELKGICYVAI